MMRLQGGCGGWTQFSTLKPFYSTVINLVLYFAAENLHKSKGKSNGDLLRHLKGRQSQYSLVLIPIILQSFWQFPSWRKAVTSQGKEEGRNLPVSLLRFNMLDPHRQNPSIWVKCVSFLFIP